MDGLKLNDLAKIIDGVSGHILDYALLLAAVGTIAMAIVELLKALTRARMYYHRFMVRKWVRREDAVLDELLSLAVGGGENANALYDQPTGKMLGQIQAAANIALDFPNIYPSFYSFLSKGSASVNRVSDSDKWMSFSPRIVQGAPADAAARAGFEAESRESTQARARLGNLVTRKLDALQTKVEYVWARGNQLASVVSGAMLFYYALSTAQHETKVNKPTLIVIALLAGLIAPFAKDVVTALTGLRAKRT